MSSEQIVGTYGREGDGSALLLYSPLFFRDANYAMKVRRGDFRILVPGDPAYREDMESLSPGEYEEIHGTFDVLV